MPPGKMHKSADARGSGPSRTDSRFAAIYSDPRFRRFPKAAKQIEVDERFSGDNCTAEGHSAELSLASKCWWDHFAAMQASRRAFLLAGMFSDPRFQAPSRVDKRGRKV